MRFDSLHQYVFNKIHVMYHSGLGSFMHILNAHSVIACNVAANDVDVAVVYLQLVECHAVVKVEVAISISCGRTGNR